MNKVFLIRHGEPFPEKWDRFQAYLSAPSSGAVLSCKGGPDGQPWRTRFLDKQGRATADLWVIADVKYLEPESNEWGECSL